jgi:hypothetical protein
LTQTSSSRADQAAATITNAVIHSEAVLEAGRDREDARSMKIAAGSLVIVLTIADIRPLPPGIS